MFFFRFGATAAGDIVAQAKRANANSVLQRIEIGELLPANGDEVISLPEGRRSACLRRSR
jgi:hypothetical protein